MLSAVEAQALPAFRASRALYVSLSAVKGRRRTSVIPAQAGIHPLFVGGGHPREPLSKARRPDSSQ